MRTQAVPVAVPILILALFLVGAAPSQRTTQESRIAALETTLTDIEAAQDGVRRRLDQMRLDLDNTLEPLRVRLADYGEDLRGVESRLVALEEQLVLMNERLVDIADSLSRGTRSTSSGRGAGSPMPPPQRPTGAPGPSVARSASTPSRPEPERSEADALYSSAYTDYLAANYPLAVSGFEQYVRLFPDSDQADNAQYWIGESYYSQQQFQLARTAFQQVSRRHPDGDTVPDALFKAARCLVEMGDATRAIAELEQLVRRHPRSDTVPIACLQIERLGAEKPRGCPEN